MKRGICCECKNKARNPNSYFCNECLFENMIKKAIRE